MIEEPSKRETRLGWWFMRTFRPKEVARRTARNKVISLADDVVRSPGDPILMMKLASALRQYERLQ